MALTYDLSTNAKWSNLADGTHNVTIIAKADGYENSEPSTAVTVTKESAYKFKHFYDAGTIGTGTIKFRHYSQQEPTPQGYQVTVTNSNPNDYNVEDIEVYENDNVVWLGEGNYGTLLGRVSSNQTISFTIRKKYICVNNTRYGVDTYSGGLTKLPKAPTNTNIDWFEVLGDGTITALGYYCLTGDTLITLANGTQKSIDELTLQDRVLAIDPETSKFVSDEITYTDSTEHKTFTEYDKWTFSDGTIVKTVHRHRFYNVEKQAMVYMDEWNIGEHAVNRNGERIALVSHENVKEEVKHYTIFTKHQNYFANGLLSGNRYTEKCAYFD